METNCDLTRMAPILDRYRDQPGSLIAMLQGAQEIYGYLPMEVMECISREAGIPLSTILGVATFYTQFRLEPVGKHLIMLCDGTACHVNSSERISAAITEELGIRDGETTADGLFTLQHVACLGCCSLSPVMMISGQTYGALTPDKTRKILRELAKEEGEGA